MQGAQQQGAPPTKTDLLQLPLPILSPVVDTSTESPRQDHSLALSPLLGWVDYPVHVSSVGESVLCPSQS